MNHADFIHLVRLSEHAVEEDAQGYRQRVARFAALGYAWVLLATVGGAALLAWAVQLGTHGRIRAGVVWLGIAGLGLLLSGLRALWLRLEPPSGLPVTAAEAPALFELIERVRQQFQGPQIDRLVLTDELNASITQVPRFGLVGKSINTLALGVPLLMALETPRIQAVLAHEYAHLRGGHGRLGAWIYRTRLTWLRYYQALGNDSGVLGWISHGFFRWFFPRFAARSFALARHDEYEADRLAAQWLGAGVMAQALTELQIKAAWLEQRFWPRHWLLAQQQVAPVAPFAQMMRQLPLRQEAAFAQDALRAAVRRLSDVADTHPALRDRLAALEEPTQLPLWSASSALPLLGPKGAKWIAQLDQRWCQEHRVVWKLHHGYLNRMQARTEALIASIGRNNANEMVELAQLQLRLSPTASVRAHYERALAITPAHGAALKGLIACLPDGEHALRMRTLESLFDASVAYRWWACDFACDLLQRRLASNPEDAEPLRVWRERLKHAEAAEQRAWAEHTASAPFAALTRDDLSDYERTELRVDLGQLAPLGRAWIASKNLREFAQRRCYTLFAEFPRLDDESRFELCRQMEHSLTLPGPVLVVPVSEAAQLRELERLALQPVFVRGQ